ncbi:hypothetical protein V6P99_34330 [Streptomyces virginiae]
MTPQIPLISHRLAYQPEKPASLSNLATCQCAARLWLTASGAAGG